jgi:hypothetical protein
MMKYQLLRAFFSNTSKKNELPSAIRGMLKLWGRHGFDGSVETLDACRGAIGLVKKWQPVIGNDYALAA